MHLVDVFYNKYYLPTVINRKKMRKRNTNKEFSLFTGNCMGGYIYHQLGLKFKSPTINLMILQSDLYKLVSDLEHYMSLPLIPKESEGVPKATLGDVTINFTHYRSFEEASEAWYKRAKRINYEQVYIIATDRDGITEEDIAKLGNVKCKKLLVFTAKKYDYPYCFQIKEYQDQECVGNILSKTVSGKWKFEKYFDFVGWLNDENPIAESFRIGKN